MCRYTCMGIARFDQEFDLNVRALLSTNQNGKITLEGGIKQEETRKRQLLTSRVRFS